MALLMLCPKCQEWKDISKFRPPYKKRTDIINKTCYSCLYGGKGKAKNMITAYRGIDVHRVKKEEE